MSEGEPPEFVQRAVAAITHLLSGEAVDLSELELDMPAVPAFHRRVYVQARRIPPGSKLS